MSAMYPVTTENAQGSRGPAELRRFSRVSHAMLALAVIGLLGGCAAEKLNREGLSLLDEGRYEEGLSKLQEAVKEDPDNTSYRIALRRNREQTENRLLLEATEARTAGRKDAARLVYQRVLKLNPDNQRAKDGLDALAMDERHDKIIADADTLLKGGDLGAAGAALKPVLLENPRNSQALLLQRKIDEQAAKERVAEPSLKGQFKKTVTLQFSDANIKMVFEALSRVSGVNVLLDKDVKPDLKVSIFVKDVTVEDAIDLIIMQSQLEKKIISDNTIFVYPNIPSKVRDYQDLMIRSFHLTNADPKQMMTMLKTVLKTKDIFLNEKINSIVIRDTPDAIRLAEKMIADQDIAEPEVMMEVEVLEVNRTRLTDIGIKWPDQLSLTAVGTGVVPGAAAAAAARSPTLFELKHLNSDQIVTSPSMSVALKAMLQDTDTNILASPRIRARNREKAKIMIGDRVPVITNAVTPVATGSPVVTGSVQYLDVGLKLEVEPDIRLNNEVAIKINLDVSSIAKEVQNTLSGTLAYQIGTRNASTLLQLKDGETQILAGLIDNQQRNSASKIPGLGQLPILGHLFSEHNNNGTKTEVILSITPHIVGKVYQPDASEVEYWSGTEDNMHTKPVFLKPTVPGNSAGNAPAANQTSPQQPAPAAPGTGAADAVTPLMLTWDGPSEAKVGDKISVTLNTQTVKGLRSLGFMMGFDPRALKVTEISKGDFLSRNNSQSRLTQVADQASGQIMVELSNPGPSEFSGSGSAVTVAFEVTGPVQQSQITLTQILPLDASGRMLAFNAPKPFVVSLSQ